MYDIFIVGSGAAGFSAAVTAKARNKSVMLLGNKIETSAIYRAEKIDNYLGMPSVGGREMMEKFRAHAESLGVEMKEGRVQQLLSMGDYFSINSGDDFYEAKTIILATGVKWGGAIKGERDFAGKGLSYCATCDGMLYKKKRVVVIGENEEAEHDANFLREICSEVIFVSKAKELKGDTRVRSVVTEEGEYPCDGVFIIGDSIPSDSLIYGIETEAGHIVTDKKMRTNIKGVFAAGDITGKPYQISKAVGEGLVAALSAVEYLSV